MKMGVFEIVDEKECYDNVCKPLMSKWVDKMKGEKCSSRLVLSREKKKSQGQRRTTWTRRRIFTHAAVGRVEDACVNNDDRTREMATWDVSRAHFHVEARRTRIYLKGHEQVGKLARLCRSMYGTRDAASIWGDTWSDVLKESSMKVGTACPAFFCSCDGDVKGLCHGDDLCVVARQKQLQTLWKSP